ncbi:MAG: glycosyltransferase family 4 protein [Chitinophagaceae bacterium]|nr:glycosyltransferase family 4 protein [Chitinophagaceae bacterium]
MQRIAGSLSAQGYQVLLVGRKRASSTILSTRTFQQKRLFCFFEKGFLFYAEYNLRLLAFLLLTRADIVCAIDLDTIMPCYFSSIIKKQKRVYDAHELFTEQAEIIHRPRVQKIWSQIEAFVLPRFPLGYTVNQFIADHFKTKYGVSYTVIRNMPLSYPLNGYASEGYILYQGAVNEGRCFESLIPAMQSVNAPLWICGTGSFMEQTRQLIQQYRLENKVFLNGMIAPDQLQTITQKAAIGLTLFSLYGLNQYQSLGNRFFDYMMAGIPQLCVNYPQYQKINLEHGFAHMIDEPDSISIARELNKMLSDRVLYRELQQNALKARSVLNWEQEELKLVAFYNQL